MEHAIILVYQHQLQKCQIIYCKYVYQLLHHFGVMFQAKKKKNHNVLGIFVGLFVLFDRTWLGGCEKKSEPSSAD